LYIIGTEIDAGAIPALVDKDVGISDRVPPLTGAKDDKAPEVAAGIVGSDAELLTTENSGLCSLDMSCVVGKAGEPKDTADAGAG
jgi:hypothetical protein